MCHFDTLQVVALFPVVRVLLYHKPAKKVQELVAVGRRRLYNIQEQGLNTVQTPIPRK